MLNWSRIEELREEVGEEAFAEVVELFLEEVAEAMASVEPGTPRLEAQLHFLKGAALNLGFDDFAGLCQAGEVAARHGRAEQVDLDAIHDCFETTKTEFMTRIYAAGYLAA